MPDDTQAPAADTEVPVVETPQEPEKLDYDQEFAEAVNKFEKADHNRKGYELRHKAKETVEAEEPVPTESVRDVIREEVSKIIPQVQAIAQEENMTAILNDLTKDPKEQKLIRFHFENSIAPVGPIRDRLENAQLLANKKAILTRNSELSTTLRNRTAIEKGAGSSSTESAPPRDNVLSPDQPANLKKKGWDDKKIEAFKANLLRNR